jgi:hypothetical protein
MTTWGFGRLRRLVTARGLRLVLVVWTGLAVILTAVFAYAYWGRPAPVTVNGTVYRVHDQGRSFTAELVAPDGQVTIVGVMHSAVPNRMVGDPVRLRYRPPLGTLVQDADDVDIFEQPEFIAIPIVLVLVGVGGLVLVRRRVRATIEET